MRETHIPPTAPRRRTRRILGCLLLSLVLLQNGAFLHANAESLFRASTTYNTQAPMASRSLFTPPIAREVGDVVTILIDESTQHDNKAELKITRNQAIDDNGTPLFNGMLGFMLDKIPFLNTSHIQKTLSAPSFNGLNNSNTLSSKAEATASTTLVDTIACQVVQVLPNGDLIVQGQKVMATNKERQNLMVSGIVRPFYLDKQNQITSKMVGNFQMIQGGKGVISRQQNDGVANKIYQFFN